MGAVDYGPSGTGEPVAAQRGERRPEHRADQSRLPISPWLRDPPRYRWGRQTLIRADSRAAPVTSLSYSASMTVTDTIHQNVLKIPASA